MRLTKAQQEFLSRLRIGHLATADAHGQPHVVPICYACDASFLYTVIDAKPKKVSPARLKRLRNIGENPRVAVVVDAYDEDWTRLAFLLLRGTARVLAEGKGYTRALRLLTRKYPQYRSMALEGQPVIVMKIEQVVSWNGCALDRDWGQR
jgi:PPOX class probable F420-dependent enzyme